MVLFTECLWLMILVCLHLSMAQAFAADCYLAVFVRITSEGMNRLNEFKSNNELESEQRAQPLTHMRPNAMFTCVRLCMLSVLVALV
jgi:hypothetical protein